MRIFTISMIMRIRREKWESCVMCNCVCYPQATNSLEEETIVRDILLRTDLKEKDFVLGQFRTKGQLSRNMKRIN